MKLLMIIGGYFLIGLILDLFTRDSDEDVALSIICIVLWPVLISLDLLMVLCETVLMIVELVQKIIKRVRRKK